jgi:hypothetical protein
LEATPHSTGRWEPDTLDDKSMAKDRARHMRGSTDSRERGQTSDATPSQAWIPNGAARMDQRSRLCRIPGARNPRDCPVLLGLSHPALPGPFVDGRYQPTAQAALFALYAAIVPDERVASVRHWLLDHLDEVKGPMSHYYLFHALYAMGEPQQDQLVLERMRTGWKPQVESPWQTTWEDLPDKGGSKAHMYGMVPGYFLTAHVLGARRAGHFKTVPSSSSHAAENLHGRRESL